MKGRLRPPPPPPRRGRKPASSATSPSRRWAHTSMSSFRKNGPGLALQGQGLPLEGYRPARFLARADRAHRPLVPAGGGRRRGAGTPARSAHPQVRQALRQRRRQDAQARRRIEEDGLAQPCWFRATGRPVQAVRRDEPPAPQPIADLGETADVAGRHDIGLQLGQPRGLTIPQAPGDLALKDVVGSRRATAQVRLLRLGNREPRPSTSAARRRARPVDHAEASRARDRRQRAAPRPRLLVADPTLRRARRCPSPAPRSAPPSRPTPVRPAAGIH